MHERTYKPTDERVLAAAAELFRTEGIAGASIRSIAEAAGVLPGSVTYRFSTKDELLVAVMDRAVSEASARVLEAIGGSDDPVERLRLGLRAHLRALLLRDNAMHLLLFDWRRLSAATQARLTRARHRYESIWDGLVYAAAAAGQLVEGLDLPLVRKFVFGAANSVALWYRDDGPSTPEEIADTFSLLIGLGTLSNSARERRGRVTRRDRTTTVEGGEPT